MSAGEPIDTGANLLARESFYRTGWTAAVVVVLCNPPLGVILYALLRIADRQLALLALVFITISTTIEAMNLINYIAPLFAFSLPEVRAAFGPEQVQALERLPVKLFGATFTVSLAFFGVFCALTGWLILRSRFLPWFLGALMMAGGAAYLLNGLVVFLDILDIAYLFDVTLTAENALALWLMVFGVNEAKWRERAAAHASPAIQSS